MNNRAGMLQGEGNIFPDGGEVGMVRGGMFRTVC